MNKLNNMKEIVEVWKQPETCYECEMYEKFNFVDGKVRLDNITSITEIMDYSGYIGRCGRWEILLSKDMCDIRQVKSFYKDFGICTYKYK